MVSSRSDANPGGASVSDAPLGRAVQRRDRDRPAIGRGCRAAKNRSRRNHDGQGGAPGGIGGSPFTVIDSGHNRWIFARALMRRAGSSGDVPDTAPCACWRKPLIRRQKSRARRAPRCRRASGASRRRFSRDCAPASNPSADLAKAIATASAAARARQSARRKTSEDSTTGGLFRSAFKSRMCRRQVIAFVLASVAPERARNQAANSSSGAPISAAISASEEFARVRKFRASVETHRGERCFLEAPQLA